MKLMISVSFILLVQLSSGQPGKQRLVSDTVFLKNSVKAGPMIPAKPVIKTPSVSTEIRAGLQTIIDRYRNEPDTEATWQKNPGGGKQFPVYLL